MNGAYEYCKEIEVSTENNEGRIKWPYIIICGVCVKKNDITYHFTTGGKKKQV